jgi:parallel beta-helix repeat protein
MTGPLFTHTGPCIIFGNDSITMDCDNNVMFTNATAIVAANRQNISIIDCPIIDISSSFGFGVGINLSNVTNATIQNVQVTTNGTGNNYGILIERNTTGVLITDVIVSTFGTTGQNYGILIADSGSNTITNTTINTNGTFSNYGVNIEAATGLFPMTFNVITGNRINVRGSSTTNRGINLGGAPYTNITNNNITTNGTNSNPGIVTSFSAENVTISGNTIITGGTSGGSNDGISAGEGSALIVHNLINATGADGLHTGISVGGNFSFVANNSVSVRGGNSNNGIFLNSGGTHNITDNNITTTGNTSPAIYLSSSSDNRVVGNRMVTAGIESHGVYILGAIRNTLAANNMSTGGEGLFVEPSAFSQSILQFSTHAVYSNRINGNPIFYFGGVSDSPACPNGGNLNGLNASHITFISCSHITLVNVSLHDGVTIVNSTSIRVENLTLTGVFTGARVLFNATNITIQNNTFTTNGTDDTRGILVKFGVENVTISNNTISTRGSADENIGVLVNAGIATTKNITIVNNSIATQGTSANYGVNILGGSSFTGEINSNRVELNTIRTNGSSGSNYGIYVADSVNNTIASNRVATHGTSANYGILISDGNILVSRNLIENNTITPNGTTSDNFGIRIAPVLAISNISVQGNRITTDGTSANNGIHIAGSGAFTDFTLQYNNVTALGNRSAGISMTNGNRLVIANNRLTNCSRGVLLLDASIHNNTLRDNLFADNSIGALLNGTDSFGTPVAPVDTLIENNTFTGNADAGIALAGPSRLNTLRNNSLTNNTQGITCINGTNNTIANNRITISGQGIVLGGGCSDNRAENNTVTNASSIGSSFTSLASLNLVRNNIISNATTGARFAGDSANNTFTNNSITDSATGVLLTSAARENRVENSTIHQATIAGVSIEPSAASNIIRNVTVTGSAWGAILAGGSANLLLNLTLNGTLGSLNVTGNATVHGFNNSINNSRLIGNSSFEARIENIGPAILTYLVNLTFTAQRTFSDVMKVGFNSVFVNGTAAPELNTSAVITLYNLLFAPTPIMDPEDDGTFAACDRCTIISTAPGFIQFNVSQFSNHSANGTGAPCVTNISAAANATFNGTFAVNVTNSTGADGLGYAAAGGDINNDSIKDLIIAAPFTAWNISARQAGRVYVVYGSLPVPASGNISTIANITIHGLAMDELLGRAVASGDVNGDGVDDVIVGSPGNRTVTVLFGRNGLGNLNITRDQMNVTIFNISGIDDLSLVTGDVNNDSIDDVVIGQPDFPNDTEFRGKTDVVFGRTTWPSAVNITTQSNATFSGASAGDFFGYATATGDLNNDTIHDVVIGAPGRNITGVGFVGQGYAFYGSPSFASAALGSANLTFVGEPAVNGINNTFALTGFALYAREDVNNDSYRDLLIGAPRSNAPPDKEDAGSVYIVFGSPTLAGSINLSNANVTLFGVFGNAMASPPGERAGAAVFARDVTNDSIGDIFVGAPRAHTNVLLDAGAVYEVQGRNVWPRFLNLTSANDTLCGQAERSFLGFAIANGSISTGSPGMLTNTIITTTIGQATTTTTDHIEFSLVETMGGVFSTQFTAGKAFDIDNPETVVVTSTTPGGGITTTGGGGGGGACCDAPGGGKGVSSSIVAGLFGLDTYCVSCAHSGWGALKTSQPALYSLRNGCCPPACEIDCEPMPGSSPQTFRVKFSPPEICHTKGDWIAPCKGTPTDFPTVQGLNTNTFNSLKTKCCPETPYVPVPFCGDGKIDTGEECGEPELPSCADDKTCSNCKCVKTPCEYKYEKTIQWFCDDPAQGVNVPEPQIRSRVTEDWVGDPKPQCVDKKQAYDLGPYLCNTDADGNPSREGGSDTAAANGAPANIIKRCCPKKGCETDDECPDPAPPQNNCWEAGDGCCTTTNPFTGGPLAPEDRECSVGYPDTGCLPAFGVANGGRRYKSSVDPDCQQAAPTPDGGWQSFTVKDGCQVTLPPTMNPADPTNMAAATPGALLFKYDASCDKDCKKQCFFCFNQLPFFQMLMNMFPAGGLWAGPTGGPGATGAVPMNLFNNILACTPPPPMNCVTAGTCPFQPPLTDCASTGTCPRPPPGCEGDTCDVTPPPAVDSPAPITTTQPPSVVELPPSMLVSPPTYIAAPPQQVTPVVDTPPEVYCAASSTGQGPVALSPGGAVDRAQLPQGYTVITTVSVGCAGNYLDITLNIPDNYQDIRAFIMRPDGSEQLGSETTETAQCGSAWIGDIRRQQISEGRPDTGYEELTAIPQTIATLEPTSAERIVRTGAYQVELVGMELQGTTTITLASPEFDVPPAAHPGLSIIGTPLLAKFDPIIKGRIRITMPYVLPAFIDPYSVSIYGRVGDQWRVLESTFDSESKTVNAFIDDISLFLGADGTALFAVMGVTCATCPNVVVEKIYNGGSRKAVLLVHGFTTDRLRWQAFIDDLVHTNSEWQIWTVSYPLAQTSDNIAAEISSLIEQHLAEFDKVSFVTHSIGGIITQKTIKHGRESQLAWPRKVADVIMAGQPGLGSPSADVYGRLFGVLVNLQSAAMVWNPHSPLITEAVEGSQITRAPGVEYFIIAGRQSYPFTQELFRLGDLYHPNDGILSIYSARTVGDQQITDSCRHYFEVPRTHTDLLDDWLPRRVMQRALFRNDAVQDPGRAIAGYNKYVRVVDDKCEPGTLVVLGKPISEASTPDPLNCKCGDGVCGEGETAENCPQDCAEGYQYRYICRMLPWLIGPLVALLVLLTSIYVYNAVKKHERGEAAIWITLIAALTALLMLGHYLFCGFTVPAAALALAFVLALLIFTFGHLHGGKHGRKIDDSSAKLLERLLNDARQK